MFFGNRNTVLCVVTGFLTLFQKHRRNMDRQGVCMAAEQRALPLAMNHHGQWEIVQSNDALVKRIPPPRLVNIAPGKFTISANIFGGFQMEPSSSKSDSRIYVSMTPFHLPLLKQLYSIVPLDPDRIAIFGTGARASTYYILERVKRR